MELVEQDRADPLEERVGQELAGEDALGEDAEARSFGELAVEADVVTDFAPKLPAILLGDPFGRCPRRHAAGLEHPNLVMLSLIHISEPTRPY